MPKDASGWVEEMLTTISAEPWQGEAMPRGLGFSEVLGRRVRTGDWQDQKPMSSLASFASSSRMPTNSY
jgi:hypothetical protein